MKRVETPLRNLIHVTDIDRNKEMLEIDCNSDLGFNRTAITNLRDVDYNISVVLCLKNIVVDKISNCLL